MQGASCEVDDRALHGWAQVVNKALIFDSFRPPQWYALQFCTTTNGPVNKHLKGGGGQHPFPKEVWSPAGSFSIHNAVYTIFALLKYRFGPCFALQVAGGHNLRIGRRILLSLPE